MYISLVKALVSVANFLEWYDSSDSFFVGGSFNASNSRQKYAERWGFGSGSSNLRSKLSPHDRVCGI